MSFQKYESKPSTINAVRFTDKEKDRVYNLLTGQFAADFENGKPILKVTTIHGEVAIVRLGDWLAAEDTPGYYYPVKDEVFRERWQVSEVTR